MLRVLTIGTTQDAKKIELALRKPVMRLFNNGIVATLAHHRKGGFELVDLNIAPNRSVSDYGEIDALVKKYVLPAISELVFDDLEQNMVLRILHRNYCCFWPPERKKLAAYVAKEMKHNACPSFLCRLAAIREETLDALTDIISKRSEVIIEGFARFRFNRYTHFFEIEVDRAVDAYIMEKEYAEFIGLLRYFVDTQKPGADIVHVLLKEGGGLGLADEKGEEIPSDSIDDLIMEISEEDIDAEDLLISNLVTLAPRKVMIHQPKGSTSANPHPHLDTIKNVFSDRVLICDGCEMCEPGDRLDETDRNKKRSRNTHEELDAQRLNRRF